MDLHDFEMINECLMHDTLGSLMMEFWQMPAELTAVIRYHHQGHRAMRVGVESEDLNQLIDIVYLANLLVKKLEIGNSGHYITKVASPKFIESLGLDEDRLIEIEHEILKKYEESSSFLATL